MKNLKMVMILRPVNQQITLFSVFRLTTTGAARSVLLKFEPRNGQPGNGRQAGLALNTSIRIFLVSVGKHFPAVR